MLALDSAKQSCNLSGFCSISGFCIGLSSHSDYFVYFHHTFSTCITNLSKPTTGTTYNLVIQPWVNAGYLYNLSNKWNMGISFGFGREINIITSGENVGEGWIGIATFSLNYVLH